jgi:hypothetical protein
MLSGPAALLFLNLSTAISISPIEGLFSLSFLFFFFFFFFFFLFFFSSLFFFFSSLFFLFFS